MENSKNKNEEKTTNFDDFKLENIFNPEPVTNLEEEAEEVEKEEEPVIEKQEPVKSEQKQIVKEDSDEDESDDDSADFKPFVQALHEKFGWEFDDETLEENSFDGVINHLGEIVQSNVQAIIEDELSIGDGSLKKMYQYLKDGGDPKRFVETYFRPVDYNTIELEDNDDLQARVVSDLLAKQGYDDDEIQEKINTYKEANILEKEANIAKKKMISFVEKEKQSLLEQQARHKQEAIEAQENYWKSVKETINSWENVGDFPILEKDKSAFFDYLNKRDKDGKTQYQRDIEADKTASIKMAYIQYKKFNTESLKKAVKTEVSKDVKKTLSKFSDVNSKSKSSNEKIESANKYSDFKLPWA